MNNETQMKQIIEAAIFVAGEPLSVDKIINLFEEDEQPSKNEVKNILNTLTEEFAERGIILKELASGFCFQASQDLAQWIKKLWQEKPPRYSRALLETLSLIAYRQPITRAEIEDVRGVAVSPHIIKTLSDREWVRVVGHKEVPGKPALYATTSQFLDYFNLKNLNELPTLQEVQDLDQLEQQLKDTLEAEQDRHPAACAPEGT